MFRWRFADARNNFAVGIIDTAPRRKTSRGVFFDLWVDGGYIASSVTGCGQSTKRVNLEWNGAGRRLNCRIRP